MEVDRRGNVYIDVIIAIDDTRIRSYDDLYRSLEAKKPGERVVLRIERDGREEKFELVLQELE